MDNRIEVEKELKESRRHEHFRHLVLSAIGVFLPFTLWALNYPSIESAIWLGFFTVVMILVSVTSLLYGIIKIITTSKAMRQYRTVLTMYANIDERTHIPETAIVTTCLRPDVSRFGFQKINYFFWLDRTELVFFPVRPEFLTSSAYHLVQSVRLNGVMVRTYSLVGNEFDDGIRARQEMNDLLSPQSYRKTTTDPIYRDTRATLIAYAVGEQTIYLVFDASLYQRLKELMPDKDKNNLETSALSVEPITATPTIEAIPPTVEA